VDTANVVPILNNGKFSLKSQAATIIAVNQDANLFACLTGSSEVPAMP